MTIDEMEELAEGYLPWHNDYDSRVAAEVNESGGCEVIVGRNPVRACRATVRFRGFQRGDSRLAFLVCDDGHAEEF